MSALLCGLAVLVASQTGDVGPKASMTKGQVAQAQMQTYGPVVSAPTGANRAVAMAADDSTVFAATLTRIERMDSADLTQSTERDFAAEKVTEITALHVDGQHVYATAKAEERWTLFKLKQDNLETVCIYEYGVDTDIPYAIAGDADRVFTGHQTFPAMIVSIDKVGCKLSKRLVLNEGENDVRSLEFDAKHDPSHLYANTNTQPARVVKIGLREGPSGKDLKRIGGVTLAAGRNNILAGSEQDGDYLYVSTYTTPAYVSKIDKRTMTLAAELTLEAGENNVVAMDADFLSVYVTTSTNTSPKVLRISKATMVVEDRLALNRELARGITAMAHSRGRLFVGADTSPATFLALNPGSYYVPKDCKLSAWSAYSACTRPYGTQCGTGTKTRSRTVLVKKTAGGASCPGGDSPQLKEVTLCDTGTVCPPEAKVCIEGTGEVFRADTRALYKPRRTCDTQDEQPTGALATPKCDCPADKPFWLELSTGSHCADKADCDANMAPCKLTKCMFLGGRVKVTHHHLETKGGFKCRHDAGRTGQCNCLCHTKFSSPSDPDTTYKLGADHPNHQ